MPNQLFFLIQKESLLWFIREKLLKKRLLMIDDKPREECGIFGIYFPHKSFYKSIVQVTLFGLLANQHRGEESAGIAISDGKRVSYPFKKMGLVKNLYSSYQNADQMIKDQLRGYISISHTRYSTTGSSNYKNAAPFLFSSEDLGEIGSAHNGNITNIHILKKELINKGCSFSSTTDSEVIGALILDSPGDSWDEKIINALKRLEGSFCLLLLTKNTLYGARDAIGNRPLSYAEFKKNGVKGYALSSETSGFDNLGIRYQREIKPGELIKFTKSKVSSLKFAKNNFQAFCGLEVAYLMRPDSRLKKIQLDTVRRYLGKKLAKNHPAPKNINYITYIPESARPAAEGFAEEFSQRLNRRIFTRTSMIKGRYGTIDGFIRGFINPNKNTRNKVALSSYYRFDWLQDKKIVLVDDSIIRGTTTSGVVNTLLHKVGYLKKNGASEVHLRIVFPPVINFCPLGTDINNQDRLIAKELESYEKIAKCLKATSLEYLSAKEFSQAVREVLGKNFGLCLGCTTGNYPITKFNANKKIFEER